MDRIRVNLDGAAIAAIQDSAGMKAVLQDAGDVVADIAARLAPKRSGAGAESIHAEVLAQPEGIAALVSWDPDHFYMLFSEIGTEHQVARPFLRPALESARI